MAQGDRRKCRCCRKLFHPDPRNRRHQRYCSAPALTPTVVLRASSLVEAADAENTIGRLLPVALTNRLKTSSRLPHCNLAAEVTRRNGLVPGIIGSCGGTRR